jgi:hypothetical protein
MNYFDDEVCLWRMFARIRSKPGLSDVAIGILLLADWVLVS